MSLPVIGVLALQGAFREHIQAIRRIDAQQATVREVREVRKLQDLSGLDAIILPGGESTTIGKLLVELEMMEPLQKQIQDGMPAFGTCAGLILLAKTIEDSPQPRLGALDISVRRNAFGRQIDSFEIPLPISGLSGPDFPAVFIRAPLILEVDKNAQPLAFVAEENRQRPVAVRQGHILGASFHPELTTDTRMHQYFLNMCS